MNIPDLEGFFPMVGIERKTDGVELTKLQVSNIDEGDLDNALFTIPTDYSKFERE